MVFKEFLHARAIKKLLKTYRLDRESAAKLAKVLTAIDMFEEINKKLLVATNVDKPNIKKIDAFSKEQQKQVEIVNNNLLTVMSNEFTSYEQDIRDPQQAITNFVKIIESHRNEITDPALVKAVTTGYDDIVDSYNKIMSKIGEELKVVNEAHSREIVGMNSAYSTATGDVHTIAEIMENSTIRKQEIDAELKKILKRIRNVSKNIDDYLSKHKKKTYADLDSMFKKSAVPGVWYRIGDQEFKQRVIKYKTYSINRWVVRKAGSNAAGSFANKVELQESGVFGAELSAMFKNYEQSFEIMINEIWQRAQLTKAILSHVGYVMYVVKKEITDTELAVEAKVRDDHDLVARIQARRKEELANLKEDHQAAVAYAQTAMANMEAASRKVPKKGWATSALETSKRGAGITAKSLLVAAVGTSLLSSAAPHIRAQTSVTGFTEGASTKYQEAVEVGISVQEVMEKHMTVEVGMSVPDSFNFAQGISKFNLEGVQDMEGMTPAFLTMLKQASFDAGFTDYHDFIKTAGFKLKGHLRGGTSIEGATWYNAKLRKDRLEFAESQVEIMNSVGIPAEIIQMKADGAQGEDGFIAALQNLMDKDPSQFKNIVGKNLTDYGMKELNDTWKLYQKTKNTGTRKWAKRKLRYAVARIAELDALLLAPHRKVVIVWELTYHKEITIKEVVGKEEVHTVFITKYNPGPDIPVDVVKYDIFQEKAAMGSLPNFGPRNAPTKIEAKEYRGQERTPVIKGKTGRQGRKTGKAGRRVGIAQSQSRR